MLNDIKKYIEEIYLNENRELFISKCKREMDFLNDFLEIVRTKVQNVNVYTNYDEPVIEVHFYVNNFLFNGGEVKYNSILIINKIVDYFYLQHEFSIDNLDPDGMDTSFDGFRDEAYNKKQFDLDKTIVKYLKDKGYDRLDYADMEEVFPGIKKFKDRDDINQMTVNNALFMDIWDLCNSN